MRTHLIHLKKIDILMDSVHMEIPDPVNLASDAVNRLIGFYGA
jgi:hypothetical protein